MRHFLPYWRPTEAEGGRPIRAAHSKFFSQDGLAPGDRLWFVTVLSRRLTLLGTMTVGRVLSSEEATRQFGETALPGTCYAVAVEPFRIRTIDIDDIALSLRFAGKADRLTPGFTGGHLQRVRTLTPASAARLEERWNAVSEPPKRPRLKAARRKL